jgi:hypothetical protein
MKKTDYEYMLVRDDGLEEVVFSSNRLRDVADFCGLPSSSVSTIKNKQKPFKFEGRKMRIISVDLKADYGE